MFELASFFLAIVATITLLPFFIRFLAARDICFTFPASNHIKYVERGGEKDSGGVWRDGVFDHLITAIPGRKLVGDHFEDGEQVLSPLNDVLHHFLGVYWYGLYPFKHIKDFRIRKIRENIQGTGPKDWLTQAETEIVSALRFRFPRPFVFTDVELSDKFVIDLKVVALFEVEKPYVPVYVHGSDFFTPLGSLIQGRVIDKIKELTINDFVAKSKGEVKGLLEDLKDETNDFNLRLVELVGVRIVSISINDYEPPKEVSDAIRQQALAEEQGKATVKKAEKDREAELINADRDAQALLVRTRAEAESQNKLSEARSIRIMATVNALASAGGNADLVTDKAGNILEMEAATSDKSKLSTLVKGGGAGVVIPVGEKK